MLNILKKRLPSSVFTTDDSKLEETELLELIFDNPFNDLLKLKQDYKQRSVYNKIKIPRPQSNNFKREMTTARKNSLVENESPLRKISGYLDE